MVFNLSRKVVFGLLLFLSCSHYVYAQDQEAFRSRISVSLGLDRTYVKDDNFSPLHQNGKALLFGVAYARQSQHIFGWTIQGGGGTFYAGPEDQFQTFYINANIELDYLFGLSPNTDAATNYFLGLTYNTRVLYLDWEDLEAFSYASTHGLSVKGQFIRDLGRRHQLSGSLAIPVLNFIGRPPYNGIDEFIIENQDSPANIIFSGALGSLDQYLGMTASLAYQYELSDRLLWRTSMQFLYQNISLQADFIRFSNTFSTGLSYRF